MYTPFRTKSDRSKKGITLGAFFALMKLEQIESKHGLEKFDAML